MNIHFYNIPRTPGGEHALLWVGDVSDPFVPFPKERLIMNVAEDREKIDMFLEKIITLHTFEQKKNLVASIVTGAAISAAIQLLQEEGNLFYSCLQVGECWPFLQTFAPLGLEL